MQPTRDRHPSEAVYSEQRSQRGGLRWTAPDVWLWLVIGRQSLLRCSSLLHSASRAFYT
uniref:Uncharacterized protein n=1 Tax=Mesocestoides corti TaxID=53468 RepID=A0A5K3FDM5_MESCO